MLRGLLQMKRGEMSSEIPEMFDAFGRQLNTFMPVRIYFSIFVVSCSSLSEVRVSNLVISRFISLTD